MEDPEILSGKLLLAVKRRQPTTELLREIASILPSNLATALHQDDQKKAFWINLYNAGFQILRSEKGIEGKRIYRKRDLIVGQEAYSLDDIEHGILRKYRWKLSLGYLPKIITPQRIKRLAVKRIDYRIHFALNCGAKSCPPIAYYSSGKLDQQLNWATQSFLESETEVNFETNEIRTTRLFQWFFGDFGGKKGIRKILEQQLQLPTTGFKITYQDYSWEEQLANFVEE